MAKPHIRVSESWQRHFAAPVAIALLARSTADVLAIDEEAGLYLLNPAGSVLLSKQLPWMPVAAAVDPAADRLAVISAAGTLLILDRNGRIVYETRTVLHPTSLDLSPMANAVAFADGAGRVGTIELATGTTEYLPANAPYYYVRFAALGADILAVGQYGQVMYRGGGNRPDWQKDFRCHTRLPAIAEETGTMLIPSPYYGIIFARPDGVETGLFEVPEGPKSVAVTADGRRLFVVNEKNELIIFESGGRILFRQPLGGGVLHFECDSLGSSVVAAMTTGALERFAVTEISAREQSYLEFSPQRASAAAAGPAVIWRTKVFPAIGGSRGGQLAITLSARFVALLDIEGLLRVFDKTGKQTAEGEKIPGRQGALKASRSTDLVVAASSDKLLALDLRAYRQRRLALRNEWATHFDISPKGIFFAVADYFRGVSLFDQTLDRKEFLETDADVTDIAVDGNRHTLLSLIDGTMSFHDDGGRLLRRVPVPGEHVVPIVSLGQGFIVAAAGRVEAFDSAGQSAWRIDLPGEIVSVQPTRAGLAVSTAEGDTFITNAHGAVVNKMLRRSSATRYFSAGHSPKEVISIEYRDRLLTARSSDSGVLWRKEMEDDILHMDVSPDGAFLAVLAGTFLYVLSTAAGGKPPEERLYLEI